MNPLTEKQGTRRLQIRMLGVQVPLLAFWKTASIRGVH